MISSYVTDNAYGKVSGITITSSGVDISGSQYVNIASGGWFKVTTGDFGIDTNVESTGYVMWSGSSTAANAGFRLKKNGELTITKLMALDKNGNESEVNLRTSGLWKLAYKTVNEITTSGGYCTAMSFSDGTSVNFKRAAMVSTLTLGGNVPSSTTVYYVTVGFSDQSEQTGSINLSSVQTTYYNTGWNQCRNACTLLERYTRDSTATGTTDHYILSNGTYVNVGQGWYRVTRADAYARPDPKE